MTFHPSHRTIGSPTISCIIIIIIIAAAAATTATTLPPPPPPPPPPPSTTPAPEIWSGNYAPYVTTEQQTQIRSLLSNSTTFDFLTTLCTRSFLPHTLTHSISSHGLDDWVFVSTGDIKEMWIRDSAVQMSIYIPRIPRHPALRRLVQGSLKAAAYFILQDPYANSFYPEWKHSDLELGEEERGLGRGGWVGTRNFELDSGAFFIHFLYNYYASQSSTTFSEYFILSNTLLYDAVSLLVDTWIIEQRHEDRSPYRYPELARQGKGNATGYTGMVWTGFRPSDDAVVHHYSIPANIYAASALERVLVLNEKIWKDDELGRKATELLGDIEKGIVTYGIVDLGPQCGGTVYAYEVNGLGDAVLDFDDANVPSLLSIPLLGWRGYDPTIYRNTRKRALDQKTNTHYFSNKGDVNHDTPSPLRLHGIGSPHTGANRVWPLSVIMRALTFESVQEAAEQLELLSVLIARCHHHRYTNHQGTVATLHASEISVPESVDIKINIDNEVAGVGPGLGEVTKPSAVCTRSVFQWANAAAVVAIEALLGFECGGDNSDHQHTPLDWIQAVSKIPRNKKSKAIVEAELSEEQWKNNGFS